MTTIRRASAHDAISVAALGALVAMETYATEGLRDSLAAYIFDTFDAQRWRNLIEDSTQDIWVAEAAGHLQGLAQVNRVAGPCMSTPGRRVQRPPPAGATVAAPDAACICTVELVHLYVQGRFCGRGIGSQLLHRARHGAEPALLWASVWERNANACRFYEREGFTRIGTTTFALGNERHRNVVFGAAAAVGSSTK